MENQGNIVFIPNEQLEDNFSPINEEQDKIRDYLYNSGKIKQFHKQL